MDYVNPKEIVQEVVALAKKMSELSIADMLLRGSLAGVFLGFATSLAFMTNAQGLPADGRKHEPVFAPSAGITQ